MSKESKFQSNLIKKIEERIPESVVMKNDANYRQGISDLLVLYKDKFALLECKADIDAPYQPNQEYWLDYFGKYTFATTIYPENEEEVLDALQQALRSDK